MTKTYKHYDTGTLVHFELDNNPANRGSGTVVDDFGNNGLCVKLTAECKEFHTGAEIIITKDEILV